MNQTDSTLASHLNKNIVWIADYIKELLLIPNLGVEIVFYLCDNMPKCLQI